MVSPNGRGHPASLHWIATAPVGSLARTSSRGIMKTKIASLVIGCVATVAVGINANALDLSLHGYARTRSHFFQDLDAQRPNTAAGAINNSRFGLIAFNQSRLRLEPTIKINDYLSVHSQFDILDNVAFGTNSTKELAIHSPIVGTVMMPAGAGSLSVVGGTAGENGSINVRRAWMDVLTPVGKFRLGRQPSNWGLGIFQNDGNGTNGDFGDTADRVMYLSEIPLNRGDIFFGALWDIAYEAQRDPRIGGLASAIADNGQDTNQYAAFLYYQDENWTVGTFSGIRRRDGGTGTTTTALDAASVSRAAGIDGNTFLYFGDLFGEWKNETYRFGVEGVYLGGKISTGVAIDAIPFSGLGANEGIISLPKDQSVRVMMGAVEGQGRYDWGGDWEAKGGFAQGDATPLSTRITQYGFRPDYQVALLMFNEPLGTSPTLRDSTTNANLTGGVPITGNFINNAYYGALTYRHHFDITGAVKRANDFSLGLRGVTAFAHKKPINLIFAELLNDNTLPSLVGRGKWYGVETDLLVEGQFFDNLFTTLEAGVVVPGSAYNVDVEQIPLGSVVATIPTDKANLIYGARLTVTMEF